MKRAFIQTLIITAFISLISYAAFAFETPVTGADKTLVENAAKSYRSIAHAFGCNDFVWGTLAKDGSSITLEYVPPGDSVEGWTRLMTVTIYPLPNVADKDKELMIKLQGVLLGHYQRNGNVLKSEFFNTYKNEPAMFVEYLIGEGVLGEHNAGALFRASSASVAFVQIQSRGLPLPAMDADKIRSLVTRR